MRNILACVLIGSIIAPIQAVAQEPRPEQAEVEVTVESLVGLSFDEIRSRFLAPQAEIDIVGAQWTPERTVLHVPDRALFDSAICRTPSSIDVRLEQTKPELGLRFVFENGRLSKVVNSDNEIASPDERLTVKCRYTSMFQWWMAPLLPIGLAAMPFHNREHRRDVARGNETLSHLRLGEPLVGGFEGFPQADWIRVEPKGEGDGVIKVLIAGAASAMPWQVDVEISNGIVASYQLSPNFRCLLEANGALEC
jgi:hypothetical protein